MALTSTSTVIRAGLCLIVMTLAGVEAKTQTRQMPDFSEFLQLAAGGTYNNYPASAFVADGTWHHIAVAVNRTINKFTVRWYVDGKDTSLDPSSQHTSDGHVG